MVLIPFLAGLLFGRDAVTLVPGPQGLNPLFGGSAFRTHGARFARMGRVLIPFLAGLLFGPAVMATMLPWPRLNPLFGGSAFRTSRLGDVAEDCAS